VLVKEPAMFKKILIAFAVLLAVFVAVGAALGDDYKVSQSITVNADTARVHELCGELKNWPEWAPWQKQDPTIQITYGEKTTGVGAHQSWTGESGSGELTLTRCDPQTGIAYDMEFIEGETRMPAKCAMNYKPAAGAVEVEWTMEGKMELPVIGGYTALFADELIGPMFMDGLTRLKSVAEAK